MVVGIPEHNLQADVVFVVEGTAVNGAYINDLRTNYIIPSLEYFNAGKIDDSNYISDNTNCIYGIVVYHAADCLPHLSSDTYGPFSSPSKLLNAIEKLDLVGGKGESHANIGEGLATALQCFEELQQRHDVNSTVQKHCILLCNSPPYSMPILESQIYSGKTAEQLASLLKEKNINLSIISPRKIPSLYKLFEKAGGDLSPSQTKNYAKDPRHLVLLKGYSLQERPISPTPGNIQPQQQNPITNSNLPITSMPSPLSLSSENPIPGNAQQNPNMMGNNPPPGMPNQYVRPQNPQGIVLGGRMIGNNAMAMGNQMGAPPGYMLPPGQNDRPWTMPPPPCQQPPRPYAHPNIPPKCGTSALLAQLNQPPSTIPGNPVNQFGQLNQVNPNQQIKINNPQQNIQTSIAQQNQAGIQTSINQVSQPNQVVTSQAQQSAPQQSPILGQPARERQTIWQGMLEWVDKHSKGPNDQPKTSKSVPCHVSANAKDGEPELRADGWPQKLMMQLMPKHLIGNIGGAYLKNSKSVLFHPQQCEALESLTRVMMSGFAGCVHFSAAVNPNCDLRVLILLYTSDKRAYLGFIPNDQQAFVDRLRRVIQQQKRMSQTGAPGAGVIPMTGAPPQIPGGNTTTAQSPQQQGQGMMISQTNTMTMGGGQITQNVSTAGPIVGQSGMIGQNVQCATRPPNIRMPNMQQGNNQSNIQQGMMGAPVQRAPFENQLQAERQQNLEKINQLKQTLEAAQQQEQQYKSQLERISHMKTAQLQEALQVAQQTEMHYKMLEQRMANPANTQVPNQPRMMRPTMPNNPGLRHLLQQQPQYRPQMMGMQQMGGNAPRPQMQQQMPNQGNNQPNSFDDVSNFDFNNIM